jgi:hypothetical protein
MRIALAVTALVAATLFSSASYAQSPDSYSYPAQYLPPASNLANSYQANQSSQAASLSAHQSFTANNPHSHWAGGMPGAGFGMAGGQRGRRRFSSTSQLCIRNETGVAIAIEISGDGYFMQFRVAKGRVRRIPVANGAYSIAYRDDLNGGAILGDESLSVFSDKAIIRLR